MNGDCNKIDFDILVEVSFLRVPLAQQKVFIDYLEILNKHIQ